ncbi:hypothetical protein Slala05_75410 [Streptomyces lavendulae subsp. lavendulae]|nr:hypothetical protein Slala05_75410 [Streptomyces lavendulae subsp. lavendulae]
MPRGLREHGPGPTTGGRGRTGPARVPRWTKTDAPVGRGREAGRGQTRPGDPPTRPSGRTPAKADDGVGP